MLGEEVHYAKLILKYVRTTVSELAERRTNNTKLSFSQNPQFHQHTRPTTTIDLVLDNLQGWGGFR